MAVTVLKREKNELRLRIVGESHTALQVLRERLNSHKDVDYANYFPGHPELDDPEFYIRTTGKAKPERIKKAPASRMSIIGKTLGEIPPVSSSSDAAIESLSS